jgi:hypothetical protein
MEKTWGNGIVQKPEPAVFWHDLSAAIWTRGATMRCPLLVTFTILAWAATAPAEEQPAGIPALRVAEGKTSFVVESYMVDAQQRGLAMRVATDGQKHLFSIFDAADNVPIFISNGDESLIYDLAQDQITFLPKSCFGFHLSYLPEEKSFSFQLSCQATKNAEKRQACLPKIEFQKFEESPDAVRDAPNKDRVKLTIKRDNKKLDFLEFHRHERDWFCYTGYEPDDATPQLVVRASLIGKKIPPELLQFPDPQKFSDQVRWNEDRLTETEGAGEFAGKIVFKYRLWFTKAIIAMNGEKEEQLRLLLPNMTSEELLKRDKKLGLAYLRELEAQKFPPPRALVELLKD